MFCLDPQNQRPPDWLNIYTCQWYLTGKRTIQMVVGLLLDYNIQFISVVLDRKKNNSDGCWFTARLQHPV